MSRWSFRRRRWKRHVRDLRFGGLWGGGEMGKKRPARQHVAGRHGVCTRRDEPSPLALVLNRRCGCYFSTFNAIWATTYELTTKNKPSRLIMTLTISRRTGGKYSRADGVIFMGGYHSNSHRWLHRRYGTLRGSIILM